VIFLLSLAAFLLSFPSSFHGLYMLCCPSTCYVQTRGREKDLGLRRQRMGLKGATELMGRRLWQVRMKKSRLVEKKRMLVEEEAGCRDFLDERKGRS